MDLVLVRSGFLSLLVFLLILPSYAIETNLNVEPNQTSFFEFPNSPLFQRSVQTLNVVVDPNFSDFSYFNEFLSENNNSQVTYNIRGNFYSQYTLQINLKVLNTTIREGLRSYIKSIEINGSKAGHEFNSTAYNNGDLGVFNNITGRSYDANLTLKWIENNIWSGVTNQYSLYIFNFTDLDEGMDHWFTINPVDMDTNVTHGGFFSGTSGLTNGRSVSAWGGYQGVPLHFIDLSSEVWFGDFINEVWGSFGYSGDIISKKLQDYSDPMAQKNWIRGYVETFIELTYTNQLFSGSPIGKSVHMETVILFDWDNYGIQKEDLSWLYHTDIIEEKLNDSFKWMDFTVTEKWYDTSDFPDLITEMNKYRQFNAEDNRYELEVNGAFLNYLTFEFVPQIFNFTGYDIILPSLVFLLDDTVFTYNGLPIAGLGGMGYQLLGLTPDRYFPNNVPTRGLSLVLLHEIGHSLGLPHPFSTVNGWSADFSASIMGYYSLWPDFSLYNVNALGYRYSDYFLLQADYLFSQYNGEHKLNDYIKENLLRAKQSQEQWDFNSTISHSKNILCAFANVYNDPGNEICDDVTLPFEDTNNIPSSSSTQTISNTVSETPSLNQNQSSGTTTSNFTLPINFILAIEVILIILILRKPRA